MKLKTFKAFVESPHLQSINELVFTGGEPMLRPGELSKMLDLCDTLVKTKALRLGRVYIATNGIHYSQRAVNSIERLYQTLTARHLPDFTDAVNVSVSDDTYHTACLPPRKWLLRQENIARYADYAWFNPGGPDRYAEDPEAGVFREGRGKDFGKRHTPPLEQLYFSDYGGFDGATYFYGAPVYVSTTGNIQCKGFSFSYDRMRGYNIGNIHETPLHEMLEKEAEIEGDDGN
jgi:hypothetical protein